MPLPKLLRSFLTFKEPRVEPGFVLAWNEPEEVEEKRNEKGDFHDERRLLAPNQELTGDLAADARIFTSLFGGGSVLGVRSLRAADRDLAVIYLPDAADRQSVARDVLSRIPLAAEPQLEAVAMILTAASAEITTDPNHGLERLLHGETLILMAGEKRFLVAETKGAPHRPVSTPIIERVIKGPHESLVEDLQTNLALVRKRLHTPRLRVEMMEVGTLSRTRCAVLHLEGITNPRLVKEVIRRIQGVKVGFLMDSGELEQLIEDSTLFPSPQMLSTERPERVAAALAEGKVAVLVDGSMLALTMPVSAIGLIHSSEDYVIRWPYGIYLRLVRILAVFAVLFLPALYVAYNLYQPEFLPTDLLFSLIAIKQRIPLPTILEVILIEFTFEILREASIRAPQYLAMPLIIAAAVFMSLAAVFTGIINPVLLIVLIITSIGAFVIPNFSASLSYRLTRYFYTVLAFVFGFIGIAFGAYLHLLILVSQKSFGVPMLAPIAPFTRRSGDIVLMRSILQRSKRPDQFDPLQVRRQPKRSQVWQEEQAEKPSRPPEGEMPEGDRSE